MIRSTAGSILKYFKTDFASWSLRFQPHPVYTRVKFNIARLPIPLAKKVIANGSKLFKGTGCLLAISLFQSNASKATPQPLAAAAAASDSSALQRLLSESDRLHTSGSEAEAYARLRAALDTGDASYQCAEMFWRAARGARAMANACGAGDGEAERRKAFTYEAFDMAKRGLAMEPGNWACHKWMGILLELTGRYEGTKKRIENSYLVRDHFRRAAEAKPDDAVVLHCLGAWCYEVADLPWYQRKLAAAFFATPPTSSYDEALGYLLKAEQADPNFYSCNLLYIGKAYIRKGDMANARVFLQRTVDYKGDTFDDRQARDEAAQLLRNC